jgi:hypothetical protein
METKFKIEIPKPCHEDWNAMTPDETGRFCSVCTKGVVDFTEMKAPEIQAYFLKNQGQKICGRFKNEQVNGKFDLQIPQSVLQQRMPFRKAFLLTLFVVMGSTLFSCKNHDNATLGEVSVVEDTIQNKTSTGLILPAKDSIGKEPMTMGKIDQKRYDSLVKAGVKMPPVPPPPNVQQVKFVKRKGERKEIITGDVTVINNNQPQIIEDNFIYGMAGISVYPDYVGGMKKFYAFVKDNYKFPKKANKVNGELRASFVIEKDGSIKEVKIIKDLGNGTGAELARVLNKSAKWYPAEHNGKKQRVYFELPVFIKNDTLDRLFDKKITAKLDSIELIRITKFDN